MSMPQIPEETFRPTKEEVVIGLLKSIAMEENAIAHLLHAEAEKVQATINYSTSAVVTVSLGAGINPAFTVRRTSPTVTDLISGLFPLLNVNVALVLTLRAVLGNGAVTLAGDVQLNAGDVVGLFYDANGLAISLNLGGATSSGIVWSIFRLS
ncbi:MULTISPECIES: hypothetical protein [Paenibacillus]|uniref:hypothetical protein n=1 Tax=Paenibacillus TaxID=44249 RepID=UPI0009FB7E78|nr:hypothetical protein [Paenibacillus lautus]